MPQAHDEGGTGQKVAAPRETTDEAMTRRERMCASEGCSSMQKDASDHNGVSHRDNLESRLRGAWWRGGAFEVDKVRRAGLQRCWMRFPNLACNAWNEIFSGGRNDCDLGKLSGLRCLRTWCALRGVYIRTVQASYSKLPIQFPSCPQDCPPHAATSAHSGRGRRHRAPPTHESRKLTSPIICSTSFTWVSACAHQALHS